jgi:hypothetical protein
MAERWVTWRGRHLLVNSDGNIVKNNQEKLSWQEINNNICRIKGALKNPYQLKNMTDEEIKQKQKELSEWEERIKHVQKPEQKQQTKEEKIEDYYTKSTNEILKYEEIDDYVLDDFIEKSPEYNEKDENSYNKIYDKFINKLNKEGITARYDNKKGKYFYDRQQGAIKGYNEMLDYLDKNKINYEISKSTEAGYVPSIYIKDNDGNVIYRVANHYNRNISDYDKTYNDTYSKLFSDKDYINWKTKIYPYIKGEII